MSTDTPTTPSTNGPGTTGPKDIGYLLTAYADGELNDEGRRWVEAQLLASPALRERHNQIRALQDALRRYLPEQSGPDALETGPIRSSPSCAATGHLPADTAPSSASGRSSSPSWRRASWRPWYWVRCRWWSTAHQKRKRNGRR